MKSVSPTLKPTLPPAPAASSRRPDPPVQSIRIVVADDHPVVRFGVKKHAHE